MQDKLFIDGQWIAPVEGASFAVVDPATEQVIHRVASATKKDIDLAVNAAREAFDHGPWPKMSGAQRAKYLRAIAAEINARIDELSKLEVLDNGKPYPEAKWDIEDTAGCFEFYAQMAEDFDNNSEEAIELPLEGFSSKAVKEPLGVAGAIIPWNFPMLMAAWKVAPALAAGCTMVLKPSELTSLTALELGVIAEKVGLPAGVLNIVTGDGANAGAPLTVHPKVDKLAFTGSVPTGTRVMQAAAQDIKNVSLELGGKSPFIVFKDADIEKAVEWILFGIFWNQGEVCSATSRVIVEKSLYKPLMKRLVTEAERIQIGNGLDDDVLLGAIVSKGQYDKVLSIIERAKSEGAKLISGGKRPAGFDKGYFIEPTILTDMDENSWVWQEEIFGPVVCVKTFKTEKEAIAMANNSRFGLAAAIMTKDDKRSERVAKAMRAGIIWINCSQPTFTEAPWGGYKQSGIGRELGKWGFENYLQTKQITRFTSNEPWGWYIKE